MMVDYRCPTQGCGKKFFEGGPGVVVKAKCRKCKKRVTPVAQEGSVLTRLYQCTGCRRKQTVDLPINERAYCMVCGTKTLQIIDEIRISPEAAVKTAQSAASRTK